MLSPVIWFSLLSKTISFSNLGVWCNKYNCEKCNHHFLKCRYVQFNKFLEKAPVDFESIIISDAKFENQILQFSDMKNQISLLSMKISKTNLREIRSYTFINSKSLFNLHLNGNSLRVIHPFAFKGLVLDALNLSDNPRIHLAVNSFSYLVVKNLSLAFCNLKVLDYTVFEPILPRLVTLDLRYNNLQMIRASFNFYFSNVFNLKNLYLGYNPIKCNCDSKWLLQTLRYREINILYHQGLATYKNHIPQCFLFNNINLHYHLKNLHFCNGAKVKSISINQDANCNIYLSCTVNFSKKYTFNWFRYLSDGSEVLLHNTQFLKGNMSNNSFTSIIRLSKVIDEPFLKFKCSADNSFATIDVKAVNGCTSVDLISTKLKFNSWRSLPIVVLIAYITICIWIILLVLCIYYYIKLRKLERNTTMTNQPTSQSIAEGDSRRCLPTIQTLPRNSWLIPEVASSNYYPIESQNIPNGDEGETPYLTFTPSYADFDYDYATHRYLNVK